MAVFIRNTHRLLTIRIDLTPGRSGGEVRFTSFQGTESLTHRSVPVEQIGIVPELSVRICRSLTFRLPDGVAAELAAPLLERAKPDEPIWLQVGPSGGQLGIVPWERLFQPALQTALLRVPNFLADPVFLTGPLRLALLVSSPRAKTAFPVDAYASQLIERVRQALPQGTQIDLFADSDAFQSLRHLPSMAGHTLTVHSPADAIGLGDGGTNTAATWSGALESPWLQWMAGALQGRCVDAVHFVCPGYFRRDQGALAVARSPADNDDREWSHMIGAGELIAFLDQIGAWASVFTPPFEDVWAMGVRLLADRLVWQRPGALMVHQWLPDAAALSDGYRFLFADHDEPPPRTPALMIYAHPKRMPRYRDSDSMAGFEAVSKVGMRFGPEGEVPEQLGWLAHKDDRETKKSKALPEDPPWKRAAKLQLDQMLVRLGDEDSPERRGALDALARVRSLLESSESDA